MPMAKAGVRPLLSWLVGPPLGEFGSTVMMPEILPGRNQTIPIAIYFAIQGGDNEKSMILCLIVLAFYFYLFRRFCIGRVGF